MAFYPQLTPTAQSRIVTDVFLGYKHGTRIPAGDAAKTRQPMAWNEMWNLSGEEYPLLTTRKKRGTVTALANKPMGILAKDALAWVDGSTLYYNGLATGLNDLSVPTIKTTTGYPSAVKGEYWLSPWGVTFRCIKSFTPGSTPLSEYWAETSYPHKQLVSMGAYLCVFPDKKYLNTADLTDYGSMEAHWRAVDPVESETPGESVEGITVTYTICERTGESIEATASDSPPDSPTNGDYWIDTSGSFDVLNRYSAASDEWAQVPTACVKISAEGIGASFREGDGVTVSGCGTGSGRTAEQISALNGSHVITACGDNWIVVEGILETSGVTQTGGVAVARTVPDMDFVCEAGNRLWGCYYGIKDGSVVNELYACALGDFKNWNKFGGLSTDSWAASCGTDGQWTGCVNYFGSPTFFKEDHIHVITLSAVGAHSVTDYAFEGVGKGCWESLTVVGSTLFYKSRSHVCAYQGGMPAVVSQDLGEDMPYTEAAGGAWGRLYYLSMRGLTGLNEQTPANASWHTFVFDTEAGTWWHEDDLHAVCFAAADGDLYALALTLDGSAKLISMRGLSGTLEGDLDWSCTTGLMTLEFPDQKYVTRFDIRAGGSGTLKLKTEYYGEYTGDAGYQELETQLGARNRTFPFRPRRCDTMTMTLSGTGTLYLVSIARIIEQGSDYNR